ncbi:MAG: hypothetical protein P1S59_04535 [bacterium]|nr:hypothetical protein [bacterium]
MPIQFFSRFYFRHPVKKEITVDLVLKKARKFVDADPKTRGKRVIVRRFQREFDREGKPTKRVTVDVSIVQASSGSK